MTVSSAVTAVDLLFGSRKIEGVLTGNPATGDATLKFSALTPLRHTRAHIRVPAHLAFSLVGLSVPGASRQSSRSGRKQPARSFPARERPPPARTATRFIENNARYVEYCGAECVGLY